MRESTGIAAGLHGKYWLAGEILVDFSRTQTVAAEAQLIHTEAQRANATGGGQTCTAVWGLQFNGEGSGSTETIDLQITIDVSDGYDGVVQYTAEFLAIANPNGGGGSAITMTES